MKLTNLDSKEIPRYTYDEDSNANRVTIVDIGIANAIKEQLKDLKLDISVPNEPLIIKEIEFRDVPVIVKEIEYREIQVPVIVTEIKVVEIEKPVIQEKIVRVEIPVVTKEIQTIYVDKLNYKLLFIFQLITLGLLVVSKFIK